GLHHLLALAKAGTGSRSGNAATWRYHCVESIIGDFIFGTKLRRWARHDDRTLQLALLLLNLGRVVEIQKDHVAGNRTMCGLAPSSRADPDRSCERCCDFSSIPPASPGVRNLGCLEMRVDSIVFEALQCPFAGAVHLRRAGEACSNLCCQVFEVVRQLG